MMLQKESIETAVQKVAGERTSGYIYMRYHFAENPFHDDSRMSFIAGTSGSSFSIGLPYDGEMDDDESKFTDHDLLLINAVIKGKTKINVEWNGNIPYWVQEWSAGELHRRVNYFPPERNEDCAEANLRTLLLEAYEQGLPEELHREFQEYLEGARTWYRDLDESKRKDLETVLGYQVMKNLTELNEGEAFVRFFILKKYDAIDYASLKAQADEQAKQTEREFAEQDVRYFIDAVRKLSPKVALIAFEDVGRISEEGLRHLKLNLDVVYAEPSRLFEVK